MACLSTHIRSSLRIAVWTALTALLFVQACALNGDPDNATLLTPADAPLRPARGYFKGVLPIPADGQPFKTR